MENKIKGIHNQSIGAYWTIFFLIFIFLAVIGTRIWINVGVGIRNKTPEPVRIEGGLILPQLKTKVNPVYPEWAKQAGIKVEIQIEVKTDIMGNVESAKVLNIDPAPKNRKGIWSMYHAAREAVLQWTFEPYEYRGEIRPAVFTVAVNFE